MVGLVIGCLYVSRGLVFFLTNQLITYNPISTALLALILVTTDFRRWHFPSSWKLPIVYWSCIVALSWPLIFLRELDFSPSLTLSSSFNNSAGLPTYVAAEWITHIALLLLTGFLWMDLLFRKYSELPLKKFIRDVIVPFSIGFCCNIAMCFYQAFFDLKFWNIPYWIQHQRVTGTMLDANATGILGALWGPLFLLLGSMQTRRELKICCWLAALCSWLCLLFTGSRSALMIAGISSIGLVLLHARSELLKRNYKRLITAFTAAGLVSVLVFVYWPENIMSPVHRIARNLPSHSNRTAGKVLFFQALDRVLYSRVAGKIIEDFPVTGVGAGSFNIIQSDYGRVFNLRLPFDNALNWYLHQFAEFGVLGSLGWILFFLLLLKMILFRAVADPSHKIRAGILKFLLIAFAIASFFGVHTEQVEILLTVWTLVFLLWLLLRNPAGPERDFTIRNFSYKATPFLILIVLVYGALLTIFSVQMLRVPERAATFGWNYSYGFHDWEKSTDGSVFRWTYNKAVSVIPVESPQLKLTIWSVDPQITVRPVKVDAFVNERKQTTVQLRDSQPVDFVLNMEDHQPYATLTLRIHPTWSPRDVGMPDDRELGVAVVPWKFLKGSEIQK